MEQMKNILCISGLLLLLISGTSCSDDFLSKNNRNTYTLSDTLYLNNTQDNVETSVHFPSLITSNYTIFMQPVWLSFNSMHGEVNGGTVPLSFRIEKEKITGGYQTHFGTIILDVENAGLFSFMVAYSNFGTPTLQCSASSLNFESTGSQTFTINNSTEGILFWNITGMPEWLIISPASGSLNKDNSTTVTASLDMDIIPLDQDLSGTLQIISNSVTGSFTISVHVSANAIIPSEVRQINGIVTDAEYNHDSGIMAICTKSPNILIVFNTTTNESDTISLSKTPSCVSLSEDGHKAVIGYSVSSVSYIDIDNMEIIEDYNIDCVPFDIVLGDNGWCYIAPALSGWVKLRNLNLISGELVVSGRDWSEFYEKTMIRKIHGKPYLVGTRTNVSPSGLLIFDVTRGIARDSISYYHEVIDKFWISEDTTKLYIGRKIVYYVPEYDGLYHTSPPVVFGQIESAMYNISALDECPATNSIFITSSYYDYTSLSSIIEQINTTNLNKIKTFNVSPVYIDENGTRKLYETSARYIFVNKDGSGLYAIKNLKDNYSKDYWTIETFQP